MVLLVGVMARAQTVPNGGFENWSGGNPVSWTTTNTPPVWVNVTQSTDAHSGLSAAKVAVVSPFGTPLPVVLSMGSSFNSRPAALHGWYKFTSVGGNSLLVAVEYSKNGAGVGGASFSTSTTSASYAEFVANTLWSTSDTPDSVNISIEIGPGPPPGLQVGTIALIDDLVYGQATDVREDAAGIPKAFSLSQNYPNPFNPATAISFQLPVASGVRLAVFDMLGRQVSVLVDGKMETGVHEVKFDGSNLASGVYFYRLQAGDFTRTKRLLLLK
jgi:hypothetical protein